MNAIIVYKSHTGYTKDYADILSKQLKCDTVDIKHVHQHQLESADLIMFGGGVRASNISGIKSFLKKVHDLNDKKIILFAVGGNAKSDSNTQELIEKNLQVEGTDYPFFYMQGGFDPGRLNFFLKAMLGKMAKSIQKKADTDPGSLTTKDQEFLDFFTEAHSDVSDENTTELVSYVKELVHH